MNIKRLVIENFKSIERIELIEPNPFTVFVGPNGSGKSNIFEALEFLNLKSKFSETERLFLGEENFLFRLRKEDYVNFEVYLEDSYSIYKQMFNKKGGIHISNFPDRDSDRWRVISLHTVENLPGWTAKEEFKSSDEFIIWTNFYKNFTRLFVGNKKLEKIDFKDNQRVSLSGSNLEGVLKRLLLIKLIKSEILEWLKLFVPDLIDIDVYTSNLSNEETLLIYQEGYDQPFTKSLVSDGTYNIIAILTAVYQSNEPQFLCIEEPENGLHPQVLMALVDFFRKQCEEKGHYIWLNTHSESLVRGLTADEIVLVNKQNGATQTKQIKGRNLYDLPTDEAWLTGALGGGLPW